MRRDGLAGAPRLLAYVPDEARSCVQRALELLGFGSAAMRPVPLAGGELDAAALRASIAADRAAGALPALLVGSAGTVNAGADRPARGARRRGGRRGALVPRGRRLRRLRVLDPALAPSYRGMERADSLTLDPHKWLGVPGRRGLRAGAPWRRPARRVQPDPALPAPGHRRGRRDLRRVRVRADAAVQGAEDLGHDRRARTGRDRRARRALQRAGARARSARRGRARARAGRRAADLDRRLPRAPCGVPARAARAGQRRAAPRPSRRAGGVRDGHLLEGRETLRACIVHPDTGPEHLAILVAEAVAAARSLV